jgi:hypothetical protein
VRHLINWEARELMPLLGYKTWREFEGAIERAKISCQATGNSVEDHFVTSYKGIPEGGEILDYLGREELASNLFRITQTEGRLRREQIVGEDAAIQAHYAVGREVRDTLKRLGATMPEDLPTADSIRGELERQRRAKQKIQRNKKQQEGQDTLF